MSEFRCMDKDRDKDRDKDWEDRERELFVVIIRHFTARRVCANVRLCGRPLIFLIPCSER